MFGIRAKVLFVYIAVSFVLNEKGKADADNYTQFRCNFEDKEYKLKAKTPIWSEELTPADMVFNDWYAFQKYRKNVGSAIRNVLEKRPLTNVEHFIRFIQAYKNQTGTKKSLEEFFNDYHVPFQSLEDPVSFLIQINNELTTLHDAKDRMYIVSAYVDPPEKIARDLEKYESGTDLFNWYDREKAACAVLNKNQFQRHVAGIIKIKYIDSNGNAYRGIIIVDPGYISGIQPVYPYSVVSMEKSTSDYHGQILYPDLGYPELNKFLHLRNKFALTRLTPSIPMNPHKVLYFRYKPFCSFMDSTTKGNLLAPHHRIISFYRNGSLKGYLEFNVVPEYISNVSRPIFRFGTFNPTTKEDLGRSFTFDSIKPEKISPDCRVEINKATEYLSLGPDYNLLGKLQTIQSLVFEDPDLVKAIYELNIRLSEKTKQPPNPSIVSKINYLFQGSCFK